MLKIELKTYGFKDAFYKAKIRSERIKRLATTTSPFLAREYKKELLAVMPERSGDLKRSVSVIDTSPTSSTVQIDSPYAAIIDKGGIHKEIHKFMSWKDPVWGGKDGYVYTKSTKAHNIPGQHFVSQARRKFESGLRRYFKFSSKKVIE